MLHEAAFDKYWQLFQHLIYCRYYYEEYRKRSMRWDIAIKIVLSAFSLSSVCGLWVWKQIPHIWTIIAAGLQILSAAGYLLPYSKRVDATNLLLPDLIDLIADMDRDWDMLDSKTPEGINELVYQYQRKWNQLESKYDNAGLFPFKKKVKKKADNLKIDYNFQRFGVSDYVTINNREVNKNE